MAFRTAAATAAVVIAVDQASKVLVRGTMDVGQENTLFGPVKLVSYRNDGVAFGAFGGGSWWMLALVALPLIAVIVSVARSAGPRTWPAAGLIVGGAVGNLIDRVLFGEVTDFARIGSWPAFNVADAAIVVGALLLVWSLDSDSDDDEAPKDA